jgi:hypothetical protein
LGTSSSSGVAPYSFTPTARICCLPCEVNL